MESIKEIQMLLPFRKKGKICLFRNQIYTTFHLYILQFPSIIDVDVKIIKPNGSNLPILSSKERERDCGCYSEQNNRQTFYTSLSIF